jgi:acetolactate synthase-1/2/3 large subunit
MASAAQTVAETLKSYGTEVFFCVTGGDQALWIALCDVGIAVVNCRSEKAAAYMADGYARISGRPGFVYGQYGPGVANVVAGLADSRWALSPVVSLTSSMRLPSRDRFEYQELEQLSMHDPVTIWSRSVYRPERVAPMVRAAIRVATGPVPGPVHLEVPSDVLSAEAGEVAIYREPEVGMVGAWRIPPAAGAMETVVERLLRAQRPVILAGSGVMLSAAWDELAGLADALSLPVVTSIGGKGAISEQSDLAVGLIGRYSRKVANDVVQEADCILAVGSRLGGLVTDAWQLLSPEAAILHIDVDPAILGHNYQEELSVLADAKLALSDALSVVDARGWRRSRTPWARTVAARVDTWREAAGQMAESQPSGAIHPARVMADLRAVLTPQDLVVADTGYMAAWAGALFPVAAGKTFLRAAGSLGWAYPAALGAALASPERRTVAVIGDGGIGYHLGEIETAIRRRIPAVAVVLNNQSLAFEYHVQRYLWDGRVIPEVNDYCDVDYGAVARAFGAYGCRVEKAGQLRDALAEALASERPAVVDVVVDKEAIAPVTRYESAFPRVV